MTSPAAVTIEQLLIGDSQSMRQVRASIRRIGPSSIPVLIQGPTGSGKELVARALHLASHRSGDFVALNVCAVAESMFEDTLFGHVRGAFTGAVSDRAGYLLEANRGTIFLDEISGLPHALQAKLLRAIETKEFRAVGSRSDVRSDFRLISATNERLADIAANGGFRHDLLYRLRGAVIEVPPLSNRLEDVPQLAQYFAAKVDSVRASRETPPTLTDDAVDLLCQHRWPGNVRELKAVIECAAALADDTIITRAEVLRSGILDANGRRPVQGNRGDFLAKELLDVLHETSWNVEAAAAILGVHRATVYRRLERIGCEPRRGEGVRSEEVPSLINLTSNMPVAREGTK